uniref:Replication factor C subunit 1 n=1 Tax=Lingulaulax polyedra TaxID=160621 RepID=A0A516AG88_LINPO|nr:replication factor C subunit 1 [Lingulodinium polyedra]
MQPGMLRRRTFSAKGLDVRLALARAFLHAGHGGLLRTPPWKLACSYQSWCDRHCPGMLHELGPERAWAQLRGWLQRWGQAPREREGDCQAALVVGRPGCGKSSGARLVGRMAGRRVLEHSADDHEGQRFLDNLLKRQRTTRDVTECSETVVVLDVPDEPTQALRDKLAPAVRASPYPIIVTCSEATLESIDAVRRQCMCLKISPSSGYVVRFLRELLQREGLDGLPESCECIAAACGGDLRRAITRLQLLSVGPELGAAAALPVPALSLPAACAHLLGVKAARGHNGVAVSIEETSELLALDASVPALVQENHLIACARGQEQQSLEGCAVAAEALALADVAGVAAQATAWGGVDEGQVAKQGLLLAAVHAVPRRSPAELKGLRPAPSEPEPPAVAPTAVAKFSAQLRLPRAYVRERATAWLLQKQKCGNTSTCTLGRFRHWLTRHVARSFRHRPLKGDAGQPEGAPRDLGEEEEAGQEEDAESELEQGDVKDDDADTEARCEEEKGLAAGEERPGLAPKEGGVGRGLVVNMRVITVEDPVEGEEGDEHRA